MTLLDISVEYRLQAVCLRTRIEELDAKRKASTSKRERGELEQRMYSLEELWREARDLAVLTSRYYERGYRRNGRYTL